MMVWKKPARQKLKQNLISKLFIPVKPVPASRPRISRYGNYYLQGYADFRKEIFRFFQTLKKKPVKDKVSFEVTLEIICSKPKKPTNDYPRGDIDNYTKAYLDSITYAGLAWEDDIQVVRLIATKRYQKDGEDYGAILTIRELKSI